MDLNARSKDQELVVYAKALFGNREFLKALVARHPSRFQRASASLERISTREDAFQEAFRRGTFLKVRKYRPNHTDHQIENKLVWLRECAHQSTARYDLPAASREMDYRHDYMWMLRHLAETFLHEGRDRSLRVRSSHLELWQDLILVVPPLLVVAAWVAQRVNFSESRNYRAQRELYERIQRWTTDSSLPLDDDIFLDDVARTHGFDECHLHLNGSIEADKVWSDALKRPDKVLSKFRYTKSPSNGLRIKLGSTVEQLLTQEEYELTRKEVRHRLREAIRLKASLLESTFEVLQGVRGVNSESPQETAAHHRTDLSPVTAYRQALRRFDSFIYGEDSNRHRSRSQAASDVWRLAALFQAFNQAPSGHDLKNQTADLCQYLLTRAQFYRLMVQQYEQIGFDQFQYITQSELREHSEEQFLERFRQFERGHQRPVALLEGRFAPKDNPHKNIELLTKVFRGYRTFLLEDDLNQQTPSPPGSRYLRQHSHAEPRTLPELLRQIRHLEEGDHPDYPKTQRRLRLCLVAHFIKRTSKKDHAPLGKRQVLRPRCRDFTTRQVLRQSGHALAQTLKQVPDLKDFLVGMDAASNERHAIPEAFAPAFRYMRSLGIHRFTYHVGEDFGHLLSGIRAIYEAMLFLDLDKGCRIGHGTALGLSPKSWWQTNHGFVTMRKEDRLDDLVFVKYLSRQTPSLLRDVPNLDSEIQHLALDIWGDPSLTLNDLVKAWELRHLDPWYIDNTDTLLVTQHRQECQHLQDAQAQHPRAYQLFCKRHYQGMTEAQSLKCHETIRVSQACDIVSMVLLRQLQKLVLSQLKTRHIAIETLPSSNVRISIHRDYNKHHASFWMGARKTSPEAKPDVVVGSDDPGIFATTLRQEYAHLLRVFDHNIQKHQLKGVSGRDLVMRMVESSRRFRFRELR